MSGPGDRPVTYLISDGTSEPGHFEEFRTKLLETVRLAATARVSMIQIREKKLTAKQVFQLGREIAELIKGSETRLLVNDRFDIAMAAGADGVQLPENGMPVAVVSKMCPKLFIIGASVHSVERAIAAENEGADFLLFGPVFDSGAKSGVGTEALADVCRAVPNIPVLAVGGIDASNCRDTLAAGAKGFGAIRYLNDHSVLEKLKYS